MAKGQTMTIRVRPALRDRLKAAAEASGRSISEEIEHRLTASFWIDRIAVAQAVRANDFMAM